MNSEIVHERVFSTATSVTLLFCLPLTTLADPPPGYYDSVDATNAATLRTTLHGAIDDHLSPLSPHISEQRLLHEVHFPLAAVVVRVQ